MQHTIFFRRLLTLIFLTSATPLGWAQSPPALGTGDSKVHITVNWRSRAESWNSFQVPNTNGSYTFGASLLRIGIGQELRRWEWQVEVAQPTLFNLPAHAVAPAPQGQLGLGASYFVANGGDKNVAGIFPRQAFLRLKGIAGDKPSSLRLGRFEFIEGTEHAPKDDTLATLKRERIAHRLIGNFGFSHVERSFDALQVARDTPASTTTVFAGRPNQGVFDVDGLKELDVDVLYGAHTRSFGHKAPGEWRLFALHYHDGRRALKTDNRSQALRAADTHNIRITTVGGHILHVLPIASGQADFLGWAAFQTGSWGVENHRASAFSAETGYQPKLPLRPWMRIGHFYGSGDSNSNDGRHETFFQVLPTPRIYARFPFYNLMNNTDDFVQLWLRPHASFSLRSEFHALRLSNTHDLWYQGGGAFQQNTFGYIGRPSSGQHKLANVVDLSADYKISRDLSATIYAAHETGGAVISRLFPTHKDANLYYVELNWKATTGFFLPGRK